MKKISFFISLTLTALLAVSSAFGEITKVEDGYKVSKCNLNPGSKFTVTVRETSDAISGQVGQDGCLKTTFRNGRAQAGNNLLIDVEGMSRSSETVPGGNGGGNPAPQPPQPSTPTSTA